MTLRVLLVEDNPGHAHLLREMLTRTAPAQFELTHVQRLDEALQRLDETPFDLALLDLSLPDSWGLETFAQARARAPGVPIIVLSSLDDEALAAQAAREGAQDYLVKGQVDGNLLVRAMRYAIERGRAEALIRAQRDLGLALSAATGLDQILRLCVEAAIHASGMDCGGVYLVDQESGDVKLAFHQGLSPQFVASTSRHAANTPPARLVMAGQPLYSQHQALGLPLDAPLRDEGLRALAVIPVHHEGQVIACFNIGSHTLDEVPPFARNALETIAAQVGSVIARVQAEQALQRSTEQLRFQAQLLDSVREAVVAIDTQEGRVIYWGKGAEDLYGYSVAEIMGKPFPFTEALQDEEERGRRRQIFETGSWRGRERQKRKDGTCFWVDSVVSLVADQDGQPFGLIGINRDVTDRVRAEEEIEKFKTISDNANYGVIIADLAGDIVYANAEMAAMHGYKAHELLGKNLAVFHGGARLDQVMERSQVLQEKGSHRVEVQSLRKDGSTFPVLMSGTIIKDQEGKPLFFTATMVDMTQRKQVEQALRESEEQYRTLFERAPIGIGLATLEGKVLAHNVAMREMMGYSEAEFGQVNLANVYQHPQERDRLLARLRAHGFVQEFEAKLKRKDGTTYQASLTVTLMALGGEDAVLTMAQDITERVRAEERLVHYAAELERSNRELQQFAQIVSHDLQEPLRTVSSYVQLLARRYEGQLDQDADDFINFALDGASHMQALIKGLLAYSRVGTHGKPFEPTDCQAVLEQALGNLRVALEENDAAVTHDPLPVLVADATQLVQLFQNLIANAIKFRGTRRPEIHVGVERQGEEWLFSVRDNGIGIKARHFERIFFIFQRLHTQAEYPGTGVGLAICRRIVERHDGRMWVESEPGQGSTFYFALPERA